jgi:hypothetical protein
MTAAQFEQKWLRDPDGILAGRAERFNVARAVYALRQRIGDGYPANSAINRVLEEPYYVEGLTSATSVLKGDTGVLDDFRGIDSL